MDRSRARFISARFISVLVCATVTLAGCAGSSSSPRPSAAEGPHQVKVSMSGLQCCDSSVLVALYRDQADWLQRDRVFKARMLIATGEQGVLTFYGLPPGTYAIAAFQDTNHNGSLDRWFGFLPREPVAFSQVDQWRIPPKFSEASFSVPADQSVEVVF